GHKSRQSVAIGLGNRILDGHRTTIHPVGAGEDCFAHGPSARQSSTLSAPHVERMITIQVTSYHDKPIAQSISADFDDKGGTIGRSPENTLVLLDPERKISRVH